MRKQSGFRLLWQEGYRIYGIGGSDSHNLIEERYDGALEPSVAGDPGTHVFSKGLTPTKLLQNLRKGHIYVSRYCTLEVEITADGETYLPGEHIPVGTKEAVRIQYQVVIRGLEECPVVYAVINRVRMGMELTEIEKGVYEAKTEILFSAGEYEWMRLDVRKEDGTFLGYVNPILPWGQKTPQCKTLERWFRKASGDDLERRGNNGYKKEILFDKDGTLIEFHSFWVQAAKRVVPEFLTENQISPDQKHADVVMEAMGVFGDDIDPNGALAYKSNKEIAEEITEALASKGIYIDSRKAQEQIVRLFEKIVTDSQMQFQTFTDLPELFQQLKKRQIRIGIATTDTIASTRHCLRKLQIEDLIDYVGADDGGSKTKAGSGYVLKTFCKAYGLEPEEVAVVGDTYNDMRFAKNCKGKAVGVLSGVSRKEDFRIWQMLYCLP